jgi:hypothetical protein
MERISGPEICISNCQKTYLRKNLRKKMENGSDSKKMRNRASRLLELATRSRFEGRGDFAGLLTDLATEILEHARDKEQRFASEDIKPSGTNFETSKPNAA